MAIYILDFTGSHFLLARRAIAHAATVVEVEVVRFCEFENTFVVARPFEGDARFLKNDFSHGIQTIRLK